MSPERLTYEAACAEFQRRVNKIPNANEMRFDDLFPLMEELRAAMGLDALRESARKTRAGWRESRLDLDRYLQVGDLVDEEMYDYFLNVLPPACYGDRLVQIGEPHDHVNGRATFATLKKTADGWVYCGHCYRRTTENVA